MLHRTNIIKTTLLDLLNKKRAACMSTAKESTCLNSRNFLWGQDVPECQVCFNCIKSKLLYPGGQHKSELEVNMVRNLHHGALVGVVPGTNVGDDLGDGGADGFWGVEAILYGSASPELGVSMIRNFHYEHPLPQPELPLKTL